MHSTDADCTYSSKVLTYNAQLAEYKRINCELIARIIQHEANEAYLHANIAQLAEERRQNMLSEDTRQIERDTTKSIQQILELQVAKSLINI